LLIALAARKVSGWVAIGMLPSPGSRSATRSAAPEPSSLGVSRPRWMRSSSKRLRESITPRESKT
jgi:hypothetical protein